MNPVMQKIILAAAAFLIVFGGLGVATYTKYNEREQVLADCTGLENEIKGFDETIKHKKAKMDEKDAILNTFAELVDILPQESDTQKENVLDALTNYQALARLEPKTVDIGASTTSSGPGAAAPGGPAKPQFGTDFVQTDLTVRYGGTFANFVKFLNSVENHPSFLRVDEISLVPTAKLEGDARILDITLKISTFHYVVK